MTAFRSGARHSLLKTVSTPRRMQTIQKSEFQHGRTRNLCASLARGEFVVFLTQDAMPVDEFWLYKIVSVLERFPRAAGAFGRHIAQPTASPFVKRDIKEHFDRLTSISSGIIS